jgi:hypothetical protein
MRSNDLKAVRAKFLPFVDIATEFVETAYHEQFGKADKKSALNVP